VVSVVVTVVSIGFVYQFSLNTEKMRLAERIKSQVRFIDAVVKQNADGRRNGKILLEIVEVVNRQSGFGKTGEFVMGERVGETIVFLTKPRHFDHPIAPAPFLSDVAEPMRRALLGESGVLTGKDYRSQTVIAAHEVIPQLGVGLVAKIDLAEFRAPFIKASLIACAVAIFSIILGVLLLRQIEVQALKMRVTGKHNKDVSIISRRERFMYFVLIMTSVAGIIMVTSVSLLFSSSFSSAKSYLQDIVKTQSNLMGAVVSFDTNNHNPNTALRHVLQALDGKQGFGESGEFVIARRTRDDIVFVSQSRFYDNVIQPVSMMSLTAKPMQQALMGKNGILMGLDYRSVEVLAAYRNVPQINVGLVAKIDLEEIRKPFFHASLLSAGAASVVVVFGAFFLGRRRLYEESWEDEQQAVRIAKNAFSMDVASKPPLFLVMLIGGGMAAIFALDLVTPLGVAGGVPYVVVVLAGWWFPLRRHIVILAVLCSFLVVTGVVLAPDGGTFEVVLVNRIYGLIVIWSTAIIISLGKASELARKMQAEELTKLSLAVEHSPSSVIMTDVNGKIEYVNNKFEDITGYTCLEVLGKDMHILQSGQTSDEVYKDLWKTILAGQQWCGDILNMKKDGNVYWVSMSILPIKSPQNEIMRFVALFEDITERKDAQEQLVHMANHDPLTGLPTRRLGLERITSALALARRDKRMMAVLFIDLDGFKAVNDTLGHEAGDQVLISVADRLLRCVREVDTVARIGGDEFMAVLVGVHAQKDVEAVAKKLIKAVSEPYPFGDNAAHIGSSIGIALYPDHGQDPELLLKNADTAMYGVKKDGKNAFSFVQG